MSHPAPSDETADMVGGKCCHEDTTGSEDSVELFQALCQRWPKVEGIDVETSIYSGGGEGHVWHAGVVQHHSVGLNEWSESSVK